MTTSTPSILNLRTRGFFPDRFGHNTILEIFAFISEADAKIRAELLDVDGAKPITQAFGGCENMSKLDLLRSNPDPTPEEIREAISGNLCRCTGYEAIVSAVTVAAKS